jgi:hypothetical protein
LAVEATQEAATAVAEKNTWLAKSEFFVRKMKLKGKNECCDATMGKLKAKYNDARKLPVGDKKSNLSIRLAYLNEKKPKKMYETEIA